MAGLWNVNLIHLFDFYLAVMLVLSIYRRFGQYEAIVRLVWAVPGHWPNLLGLIKQHHTIFLTWTTVLPAVLALTLTIIQVLASRVLWSHAALTPADVANDWLAWPFLGVFGVGMLAVDLYFILDVSEINRADIAKYFDEAEYWLRSWKAPVVHFFTLGRISPRKVVAVEVQKALVEASQTINVNLWWVVLQVFLRVGFGLSLWLTWALARH